MRSKNKSCCSQVSSHQFIRTIVKMLKVWHWFNFYCCYDNKNGLQNMLKIGKRPFWSKFETCNRGINIEHEQIPTNILTDNEKYNGTQYIKRFFLVFAFADI